MRKLSEDIALNDDGNGGKPEGWKQTSLSDLLNPSQMQQLQVILKKHENDADDALVAMKKYFNSIGPDLQAKGILPDYLAYVLYAKITNVI